MKPVFTLRVKGGSVLESYGSLRSAIRAGVFYDQPEAVSDYVFLEVYERDDLIGDPNEIWAESGGTKGMFR